MTPDSVVAIVQRLNRAKRALSVSHLLAPLLFFGLIEVLAYRKQIGTPGFELSLMVLFGLAAILVRWTVRSYRLVVPVQSGEASDLDRSEDGATRWRWRLVAVAGLSLLVAVFIPGDGPFGAWPVVNVTVVLRMLVAPLIAAGVATWYASRFFAALERGRTIKLKIQTTTAQIIALCATLTLLGLVVAGLGTMIGTDLKIGFTLSPFGYRKTFLHSSPEAFWTYIELYAFIALSCFALCVRQIFEIIAQDKRRESSIGQKVILWGFGVVYSSLLGAIGWCLILGNSID
jgi:hypothetical protein